MTAFRRLIWAILSKNLDNIQLDTFQGLPQQHLTRFPWSHLWKLSFSQYFWTIWRILTQTCGICLFLCHTSHNIAFLWYFSRYFWTKWRILTQSCLLYQSHCLKFLEIPQSYIFLMQKSSLITLEYFFEPRNPWLSRFFHLKLKFFITFWLFIKSDWLELHSTILDNQLISLNLRQITR